MKKLVMLLVVLAIAAPALAEDVEVTGVDKGGGVLGINYTANAGNGPRAFAIEVTLTDCDIDGIGDVLSVHSAYNVNIDYAYSQELGVPGSYVVGSGHPLALVGGPGEETVFPATTFVISVGVLDEGGNQLAGPEGVDIELVSLQLTSTEPIGTVVLTANAGRGGGVATDNPGATSSYTGTTIAFGPACWSFTYFGCGDGDGNGAVGLTDFNILKAAWSTTDGVDPAYNACGDFDKNGAVGLTDFNRLKANWSTSPAAPCP